jgi:hypothetical protein
MPKPLKRLQLLHPSRFVFPCGRVASRAWRREQVRRRCSLLRYSHRARYVTQNIAGVGKEDASGQSPNGPPKPPRTCVKEEERVLAPVVVLVDVSNDQSDALYSLSDVHKYNHPRRKLNVRGICTRADIRTLLQNFIWGLCARPMS